MGYWNLGIVPHGLETDHGFFFRAGEMGHDGLPHWLELWVVPLGGAASAMVDAVCQRGG